MIRNLIALVAIYLGASAVIFTFTGRSFLAGVHSHQIEPAPVRAAEPPQLYARPLAHYDC